MNKTFIFLLLIFAATNISFSTTHTITNSGLTFTPSSITINLGDTVNFVLQTIHTAREVSQSTWNANGTTSNGGFDLPFGGGTVVLTQSGVHYYVCVPHAASGMKGTITVNIATDVNSIMNTIPDNFILMQNYPNPFNPSTAINYQIPEAGFVTLRVYDVLCNEVAELVNENKQPGYYEIEFNAVNLSSSVYIYRLSVNDFVSTKKMILMK